MKKIIISKLYILFALIHTLITFKTDKLFFTYAIDRRLILYKILLFIILTLFYKLIFNTIKKLLKKDKRTIKNLKIFSIYFIILLIFFLLCYPGNFKNDEMFMIDLVKILECDSWYHVLTYYLYALSLMIIPFLGGISFIQSFICSLIFIYIYDKVMEDKKDTKLSYILFIPFLLLPVISSNLYPYRPSMYAYFEVFLIFYLYYKYYNKDKLDWKFFVIVGIFTAILANFRSEGIYYLICLPIGIILFFIKKKKEHFIGLFIMLILTGGIFYKLKQENEQHTQKNEKIYSTLTYVLPLSTMLNEELKGDNLEKNIDAIDKVLDVEKLKECASYKDADPVWLCGALRGSNNNEEYNQAFKSFIEIAINNPIFFIESRMKTFLATSALDKTASNMIYDSSVLYDDDAKYYTYPPFRYASRYNIPISTKLRKITIRLIEGRDKDYYFDYSWTYPVFYNLIIPFLFLGIYILNNLIKKKWFNACLFALPFIRLPLIFLTAPACYFMYYFPIYWISMILMIIVIFEYLYNKKYQKELK